MKMNFLVIAIILGSAVLVVKSDPTMYKKNEQNLYEPGESDHSDLKTKFHSTSPFVSSSPPTHHRSRLFCLLNWRFFLDLIPVSSTVIPELEMPEDTAETDQQYLKAYYSLFKKKFNAKLEKSDSQGDKNKYKYKYKTETNAKENV